MDSSRPPTSKRALKRQAREEQSRELRKMKKLAKKEEKRNDAAAAAAQGEEGPIWEHLPNEPPNPSRQDKKTMILDSFAKAQSDITLCIDCAFEDKMTEGERKVSADV